MMYGHRDVKMPSSIRSLRLGLGRGRRRDQVAPWLNPVDAPRPTSYAYMSKVDASMPPERFPIPQGTLDMLILQILSLEPAHGYAIAQRIEQISRHVVQVGQGSLYPALHRLEQKTWLRSEWRESETGREAKFYSLTRTGRQQLAREKESWDRLTAAVRLIFDQGD